jgi:hypothetical protein
VISGERGITYFTDHCVYIYSSPLFIICGFTSTGIKLVLKRVVKSSLIFRKSMKRACAGYIRLCQVINPASRHISSDLVPTLYNLVTSDPIMSSDLVPTLATLLSFANSDCLAISTTCVPPILRLQCAVCSTQ